MATKQLNFSAEEINELLQEVADEGGALQLQWMTL